MFNDFVIVGPENDPAGVKKEKDLVAALKRIVDSKVRFISRGDNSGTDVMEQKYWKQLGDKPKAGAYVSAGLGMGEVLTMAAEMQAYTLSDRATYAAYKAKTGLQIVLEGDKRMLNPYGIVAVNPAKFPEIRYAATMKLIEWISSDVGKKKITAFKVNGEQVFFPY
jgi:tungstate transport system substrate-binding protein